MCQCGTCASCDRSTLHFAGEAYQFDNLHWIQLLEKERYLWSQAELYFDSWTIVYCVEIYILWSQAYLWSQAELYFDCWTIVYCVEIAILISGFICFATWIPKLWISRNTAARLFKIWWTLCSLRDIERLWNGI